MNDTFLIIVVLLLTVLIAVFSYNMYQESRYRNKIRDQFGHSDNDALLNNQTQSVRDGQNGNEGLFTPAKLKAKLKKNHSSPAPDGEYDEIAIIHENTDDVAPPVPASHSTDSNADDDVVAIFESFDSPPPPVEEFKPQPKKEEYKMPLGHLLIDLVEFSKTDLPWFDKRIDYMAYVSLSMPQELYAIPRLSSKHFQMIACTMDNRFQLAEPIPGVAYQGFAIGLQAISRDGLTSPAELERFGQQVRGFTDKLNGECALTDVPDFLKIAQPLDDLCNRVDQTIAIHLVAQTNIQGTELRPALERVGFQLQNDGTFSLPDDKGDTKFTASTLDGSRFTESLMATQSYKGFSMLFDITRVPAGEQNFHDFMKIAQNLSVNLNLELVDDQIQSLTPEWLREVSQFVYSRQNEMLSAGIEPGGRLAQRLFS